MTKIFATVLMAFVLLAGVAPKAAQADTLYWTITNSSSSNVELEFYSQDYNSVWPGNNEVWVLNDYDPQGYNLECNYGELICYGAWIAGNTNVSWGVGFNQSKNCPDCCATCGQGDVDPINLID